MASHTGGTLTTLATNSAARFMFDGTAFALVPGSISSGGTGGIFATQAEAVAGVSATTYMSPVRTKDAITGYASANEVGGVYGEVVGFNSSGIATAIKIGLIQCLAMIPGVSRSGATITGALLLGADKRAAAEFSFFLSMPTMLGAFVYDLYKNRDILDAAAAGNIAVGFVCAFLAALVVVRWLLNYVSVHGYAVFAWWRIVVGSLAALALLAGW